MGGADCAFVPAPISSAILAPRTFRIVVIPFSFLDAGSVAAGIYRCLAVGDGSWRTAQPVSSMDFRLEMIFCQPPDTAVISFAVSRSMVWGLESLTADPLASSSIGHTDFPP